MAIIERVAPYADDEMNLPVKSVDAAISFYQEKLGFEVVERSVTPNNTVVLARNGIKIGLVENGGDPAQEGCFFEVDDVEGIFNEFQRNGLDLVKTKFRIDKHGENSFKVFFVVAPDGLCYCLGELQK